MASEDLYTHTLGFCRLLAEGWRDGGEACLFGLSAAWRELNG